MKRLQRFLHDDRAQALTEYVVIIPLVLFVFFAMLETLVIAQTAQLANYAAFSAARSYATSYSKFKRETNSADQAKDKATDRAKNAALMVMAPVSHAQVGEGLQLWNPIRNAMSGAGQTVYEFYGLAEGFAVALIYRMKEFTVTAPPDEGSDGSPTSVVKVSFEYLVPMTIPGFAEMWDFFYYETPGGGKTAVHEFDVGAPFIDPGEINSALNSVLDVLVFLEGLFGDGTFGGFKQNIEDAVEDVYSVGFLGALHNVQINAKSVCGFEPWSGNVRTDDIEDYCEGEVDPEMEACANAAQSNQEQAAIMNQECDEANDAKNAYDQAVAAYEACANQPGVTNAPQQCSAEFQAMNEAYAYAEEQQEECDEAGEELEEAQENMEANCNQS